jgi:hypothetical protein
MAAATSDFVEEFDGLAAGILGFREGEIRRRVWGIYRGQDLGQNAIN